ncbi:hypothetical protein LTR66_013844, partial [Elasticomyces elasticus]
PLRPHRTAHATLREHERGSEREAKSSVPAKRTGHDDGAAERDGSALWSGVGWGGWEDG